MASDDQCDLDELQALLDMDEDLGEDTDNAREEKLEAVAVDNNDEKSDNLSEEDKADTLEVQDKAQSMAAFLEGSSDEEEDQHTGPQDKEEPSKSQGKSVTPMKATSHCDDDNKSPSPGNDPQPDNKGSKPETEQIPNETEMLRAQMAQMQQQLLDMQKMLSQSQQPKTPSPETEANKKSKESKHERHYLKSPSSRSHKYDERKKDNLKKSHEHKEKHRDSHKESSASRVSVNRNEKIFQEQQLGSSPTNKSKDYQSQSRSKDRTHHSSSKDKIHHSSLKVKEQLSKSRDRLNHSSSSLPSSRSKLVVDSPKPHKSESQQKSFLLTPYEGDSLFHENSVNSEKEKRESSSSAKEKMTPQIKDRSTPQPKKQLNKPPSKKLSKDLFGDSDSDWDEMDGEDKRTLNDAGKEIKRLIKTGEKQREAHTASYSLKQSPPSMSVKSKSWSSSQYHHDDGEDIKPPVKVEKVDKGSLQCKSSSTEQKLSKEAPLKVEEKVVIDDFSKIRIVNPLVSSYMMRSRMEGRKIIGVPRIHTKVKTADLQGDWVTIGVVIRKHESKSAKTGSSFSIWTLNDLEDLDNSVGFFLFGEVYKTHWKLDIGTVVGVLNPSLMEKMEKNGEPAFTVKNPAQVMVMGRSKDLGWCVSRTKAGNKCTNFLNTRLGEYCAYHVQQAYRKTSSQRLELHGSINGLKPKSFQKKVFSKDTAYIYGGQTFVPYAQPKKNTKDLTLSKLAKIMPKGQINTLSIQEVKVEAKTAGVPGGPHAGPLDTARLPGVSEQVFSELVSVPSPGSMNLVAHLKKKEDKTPGTDDSSGTPSGKYGAMQSIKPKDLLKQHRADINAMKEERKRANAPKVDPLSVTPMIGKGFYSGQQISLDIRGQRSQVMSSADRAKLKAIAAITSKGGLKKDDPNAVRKEVEPERVRKRLQEGAGSSSSDDTQGSSKHGSSPPSGQPPKKKSRLLGNVDMNSPEVKALMKRKSKHTGALSEAELEREEAYFTALEKKEQMEDKLQSVTSICVKLYTCRVCNYTASHVSDLCKKEGHNVQTTKAAKRFFACRKCKHRTSATGQKWPTEPCSKCGQTSYERCSMYKEKSGPKLASETLCLRGDEVKYIGGEGRVYLSTVPEG